MLMLMFIWFSHSNAHSGDSVKQLMEKYEEEGYDLVGGSEWSGVCYYGINEDNKKCNPDTETAYSHNHMHILNIMYDKDLSLEMLKELTTYSSYKFDLKGDRSVSWKLPNGIFYSIWVLNSWEIEVNLVYKNFYFNSGLWSIEVIKDLVRIFIKSVENIDFYEINKSSLNYPGWQSIEFEDKLFLFNKEKKLHLTITEHDYLWNISKDEYEEYNSLLGEVTQDLGFDIIDMNRIDIIIYEDIDNVVYYTFDFDWKSYTLWSKNKIDESELQEILRKFINI